MSPAKMLNEVFGVLLNGQRFNCSLARWRGWWTVTAGATAIPSTGTTHATWATITAGAITTRPAWPVAVGTGLTTRAAGTTGPPWAAGHVGMVDGLAVDLCGFQDVVAAQHGMGIAVDGELLRDGKIGGGGVMGIEANEVAVVEERPVHFASGRN